MTSTACSRNGAKRSRRAPFRAVCEKSCSDAAFPVSRFRSDPRRPRAPATSASCSTSWRRSRRARLLLDPAAIADAIAERERLGSTGFGGGVAIPHGKLDGLERVYALVARLAAPIDYKAIDGAPVDLVFLLLSPPDAGAEHLKALAAVSRLVRHARDGREAARRPQPRRAGRGADGRRGTRCRLSDRRRPGAEAHLRALEALYDSAPVNRLFESRLELPEAGRSEIRFTVAPDSFPRRRRRAWHALFQDARRRGFLCRQQPGQRPLPADHRLQPAFHQADASRRGARRGTLDLAASGGCSSPRRGSSMPTARNARAAPAPSCARTSRCRASPAIAPADGRAAAGASRGGGPACAGPRRRAGSARCSARAMRTAAR